MKKILLLIMSVIALQLNAQTITNYSTADGLLSDFVECIDADINDNIWFGTSIGVQKFDGSNWTTYTTADGLVNDNVKVISSASNGDVWFGTDFGASQFDGTNWVTYNNTSGLNSSQVKSIDEDANGGIWVGTNLGVSYFDGTTWTSYSSPDLHWSGVNATAFDSNGDVWFASPLGGTTHFDGTTFTPYDTANGLLSQYVTDILVDNNDNKWVGTSSGMSVLDASNTTFSQHTQMYLLPPPDTLNPVVDIAFDAVWGYVWTAIYVGYLAEGGVAMWNGNQWIDFDVSDGLAGPNVKGLIIDSQHTVWVATSTGVSAIMFPAISVIATEISAFNLFPNPSNDVLYLTNENQDVQQVKMYNNLGALVYVNNNNQPNYSIDVSSYAQGLYYVNIHCSDAIIRRKIVVK
jgi:ligand-binding sensor domain-containing protein